MINQITVFLENREGRLASLCRTLSDADINMYALSVADTSEYGLARIICDDPQRAIDILKAGDYRAMLTPVSAIGLPNEPGSLAKLLETLDSQKLNIEYGYCFAFEGEQAVAVLKISDMQAALAAADVLIAAGFTSLSTEDLQ